MPLTWSDANASPSVAGDENVITYGAATITLKGDSLRLDVGGSYIDISAGGIKIVAPRIDLNE